MAASAAFNGLIGSYWQISYNNALCEHYINVDPEAHHYIPIYCLKCAKNIKYMHNSFPADIVPS